MATTETTMTTERLDAFMDAWNAHDVDAIVGFFADDCVFHPSVGTELMGGILRRPGRGAPRRSPRSSSATRTAASRTRARSSQATGERPSGRSSPATRAVRGCDLFEFEGDRISVKNAFRKNRP